MRSLKKKLEGDDLAIHLEDHPKEWVKVSVKEQQQRKANLLKKEKRITLRISSDLLEKLRNQSFQEGLPYQTYINFLLNKSMNEENSLKVLIDRLTSIEKKLYKNR